MPVCPESVRGKYFLVEINPSENFPIIKKMHKYDFIAITIVKRVLFPPQKATRITSTKPSKSINKNRFTICSTLISMNPVSSLMGTDTKSSMFDTHTQRTDPKHLSTLLIRILDSVYALLLSILRFQDDSIRHARG